MRIKLILVLVLFAYVTSPSFAQVKTNAKKASSKTAQATPHRIVYDMTAADTTQQSMLMRQLNNIKRGWPEAQIEIVVHGKALDMLVSEKSTNAAAIKELQEKGVVFAACENSMRARKVEKAQLLPGVITVPMGIGEVVMKQEEGWSYIKF
ncbi:DsrE family protein [Pontibacter anaerobius]|uniref:DsrE family protein n=1 Tax=Pontibacter anaerobius TaxID=2993940 RepID=A0ABT3RAX4_9BACT|nr:DsrE family protein [Pontibacter anaerobius]MCX2739016.1 DsrE family protein [Pontibacter anaerobius]